MFQTPQKRENNKFPISCPTMILLLQLSLLLFFFAASVIIVIVAVVAATICNFMVVVAAKATPPLTCNQASAFLAGVLGRMVEATEYNPCTSSPLLYLYTLVKLLVPNRSHSQVDLFCTDTISAKSLIVFPSLESHDCNGNPRSQGEK